MTIVKKVYLPKWIFWMVCLIMVPLIVFFNISYFTNAQSQAELGTIGWLALIFVFVVIIVMMYLMAFRKLPSYIIEEEEKK
ncbi:MAG: hypothetical protein A2Z27_03060 [candidate division Zixibacteria bacterium RBG_16_50_21]|nr:MAG: hypothetical protein A2Z27_03060 [candidate division Zixibacteria bacterium RBG_16_50_21]